MPNIPRPTVDHEATLTSSRLGPVLAHTSYATHFSFHSSPLQLAALPAFVLALAACSGGADSQVINGDSSVNGGASTKSSSGRNGTSSGTNQSAGGESTKNTGGESTKNRGGASAKSTGGASARSAGGAGTVSSGGRTAASSGGASALGGAAGAEVTPVQVGYVSTQGCTDCFPLIAGGKAAVIVASKADFAGVLRTAKDLQVDVERVGSIKPLYVEDQVPTDAKEVVLVGTLGKAPLIDKLVTEKKLDVGDIAGLWETFLVQVVQSPMAGVDRALVITGSDQRGTIYGIYDVSKQIGVSPWHYWADVPVQKKSAAWIVPGHHTLGSPAVKYRGIFINDENPQLGSWALNTFGKSPNASYPQGFHSAMYAKVYELMLRIKANYLWPAVWGRAFAEDDPKNHEVASAYGIIIGTSHEAPMMRGIEEWSRHKTESGHGTGEWKYTTNADALKAYWTAGIKRMVDEDVEGIVTIGMRGEGDVPPADQGIATMKSVVAAERDIIKTVTGKDPSATPQVWTLYKEIQDYWDQGMRVPDDVTVVWCDDNWGNMRELPKQSDPKRVGGYGLYYHFDYVGEGRNYKWVDTTSLPNLWEQLNLSYSYGVDRLWMVNVGDMKNDEHPIEFFMDYAWNPRSWPIERLQAWEEQWAAQQFGQDHAASVAQVATRYGKLQSRRKPELTNRAITLDPSKNVAQDASAVVFDDAASPFSLVNYRELEGMVAEWSALAAEATAIRAAIPTEAQDAYYELVFYPVQATAHLYSHRLAVFRNKLYKAQGRASTNDWGATAQTSFDEGTKMATYYNTTLASGKWKGWQTQPYVGYGDASRNDKPDRAGWQQPERNDAALPDAPYPTIIKDFVVPAGELLGVSIDGSEKVWPVETTAAKLPKISRYQTQPSQYIEVFRRGAQAIRYEIAIPSTAEAWLAVAPKSGTLDDTTKEVRAEVTVDWAKAPAGTTEATLTVTGAGKSVPVAVVVDNTSLPTDFLGFVEASGYVAIEAEHFSRKVDSGDIGFKLLPDIGRTGSGLTPFPVTAASQTPKGASPHLQYDIYLSSTGTMTLWAYLSPRNNVLHNEGLRYAVSIDDAAPQTVDITTALNGVPPNRSWQRNTSDNVNLTSTKHTVSAAGKHTVKFWMVDPAVVVQKLVLDAGGMRPSYLGPPESHRVTK